MDQLFSYSKNLLNDKVVLVTGGTGSFGKAFVRYVCENFKPRKLIIFSRDELKQFEMAQTFSEKKYPFLRYFVGDIRDRDRLNRAFAGVDVVVHAAAMKQVPTAEYNPLEAIKTNVDGARNLIDAAIDCNVKQVVALSTDKACNPVNLYGATKLCAEKLFVAGNAYVGDRATRFSVVRYGNVVGSRGSIVPFFRKMKPGGVIPITDERMTRFWITLEQGVTLVLSALDQMAGGEIFIPKIPSMKVVDLANILAPECRKEFVGVRPGEKIHEMLMGEEEARTAFEREDHYVIYPQISIGVDSDRTRGKHVPEGFSYTSANNATWFTREQMIQMLERVEIQMNGDYES